MEPKRPTGRKKNITGQGKDVKRRGSGLGTGPVGGAGRVPTGGAKPSSSGGGTTRTTKGGMSKLIIILLVALLGGGGGLSSLLFGGGDVPQAVCQSLSSFCL